MLFRSTEFATEAIEEALLFIPARLNAPWIRLLDRYPRVFLESTSPAGEQPLMLVGLIHSERAIEFHAAFKTVGSVFYPISFISEDLES